MISNFVLLTGTLTKGESFTETFTVDARGNEEHQGVAKNIRRHGSKCYQENFLIT